jgi:hypothetical protein
MRIAALRWQPGWHSRCFTPWGMKPQRRPRGSKAGTRRRVHPTVTRSRFGSIVPHIVTLGILAFGTTAFAGGAKGLVLPPPGAAESLLCLLAAVTFFVLGACMWFVLGVFTDPRFMRADPRAQVKLAREALAPVLEILGLLHKPSTKPVPAT